MLYHALRFAPVTLLALALGSLFGCAPTQAATACSDCNVLWITVDTLRFDRVGAYGFREGLTPAIDRLAARGVTVKQAVPSGPMTILSVPAYLSSRHRFNTGMTFDLAGTNYVRLPGAVTTLAEALHDAGRSTAAILSNPVLGYAKTQGSDSIDHDPFNLSQGFDSWRYKDDPWVEKDAIATLGDPKLKAAGAKPFFLYVHFMGPHDPNGEIEGFESRRGKFNSTLRKPSGVDFPYYLTVRDGKVKPTIDDILYVQALYDDAVWEVDGRVGRVLAALDAAGLSAKTEVVLVSDHGEALGEVQDGHPWFGHGQNLRSELIHVPLIMAGPGIAPGTYDRSDVVELVDVAPTLLGLLGIAPKSEWQWDGQAFLGPTAKHGTAALTEHDMGKNTFGAIESDTLRIVVSPKNPNFIQRFNWLDDPLHTTPLAASEATEALLRLRRESWSLAHPPPGESISRDDALGVEEQCQMILLGYLDPSTMTDSQKAALKKAGCTAGGL